MNLPEMLREREVMVEFTPPDLSGKAWARGIKNLGPELAALVEADNKLCARVREVLARDLRIAGDPSCEPALQDEHKGHDYDLTGLLRVRDVAYAALVAKIGGKG